VPKRRTSLRRTLSVVNAFFFLLSSSDLSNHLSLQAWKVPLFCSSFLCLRASNGRIPGAHMYISQRLCQLFLSRFRCSLSPCTTFDVPMICVQIPICCSYSSASMRGSDRPVIFANIRFLLFRGGNISTALHTGRTAVLPPSIYQIFYTRELSRLKIKISSAPTLTS